MSIPGSSPRRLSFARTLVAACLAGACSWAWADADLSLSQYTSVPDNTNISNGATITYTIRVNNLGPDTVSDAEVTVSVGTLQEVTTTPAGCALTGSFPGQTLTCPVPTLNNGDNAMLGYTATARTDGTGSTSAAVTSAAVADPVGGNNSESLALTVITAGDLTIGKSASVPSAPAGTTISYTLTPNNAGPDDHSSVRVTDNLPAVTDFEYQSANGTDWSCSHASAIVTCDYTGGATTGAMPSINITGRIVSDTAGSITNIAAIESTSLTIGDPDISNDSSGAVVVTVTAGTDAAAGKSMPAIIVTPNSANVTLSINNLGPQLLPAGATISDTFSSNLTIDSVPGGCAVSGQLVTCTAGIIASLGSESFAIGVSGATAPGFAETNQATVSMPAGMDDPDGSNNTANANFEVVDPTADLALTKTKSPNPVGDGAQITNTVTIRNHGPSPASYAPVTPITVVDTLDANETFLSSPTAGFSCTEAGGDVTCSTTGAGTLAVDATLDVVILTQAGASVDQDITNTVCANTSGHTPLDNIAGNNCDAATARGTNLEADLSIFKEVALSAVGPWSQSGMTVTTADDAYFVRLQVTNNAAPGPNVIRTVNVADTIPNYVNETLSSPAGSIALQTNITLDTTPSDTTCNVPASSGAVTCTMTDLDPGETKTVILQVDRAFGSGAITNIATATSPDTTDPTPANNTSSASFTVDAVADIVVNSKTISPTEPRAGQTATYVISVKNVGANPATAVTLTDNVDETLFDAVLGSATTTKPGGSCSIDANADLSCTLGTFNRNDTFQVTFAVIPKYPFGSADLPIEFPVSNDNTASVATTAFEAPGHQANSETLTHNVNGPLIDLRVTKQEPDASYDPAEFGNQLVYDVRISNGGASRAQNIQVTDTPTAPVGYAMNYDTLTVNPVAANGSFTLRAAPNATCSGTPLVCVIDTTPAGNYLDPNEQVILRLFFDTPGADPNATLSFNNAVAADGDELAFDPLPGNNSASQSTTVLPSTDLQVVSKTRAGALLRNINEPIDYDIVVRNNGPSNTTQIRVTDDLPSGFAVVGTPTTSIPGGSSATVSGISCSGSNNVVCTIDGSFPAGAANIVNLQVTARAQHPYSQALDTNRTNTASIDAGLDGSSDPISRDSTSGNNLLTALTQIQEATLAGQVYDDQDRNASIGGAEGIENVTINFSGTDLYGNNITGVTTTTNATGNYSFTRLPPGASYSVIETQPSNYFDRNETAGGSNGTVNNASYGDTAGENTISAISLTAGANIIGYLFQEFGAASLSGVVYNDANNDGTFSGEAGIAIGATNEIRLTGTDYAGNAINQTADLTGSGAFSFNDLPASDATGYTLKQDVAAPGFLDGTDENGSGNVIANSAGRTLVNELITPIVLDPSENLTNRNFGEIAASTISGMVFLDLDGDATRDGNENAGFSGAVLRLTGTNDLAQSIDCSITTTSTGLYSFPNAGDADPLCQALRPGTYALNELPPVGITHTGAYIGSAGGTAGTQSGANTPSPGATIVDITNIIIVAGSTASNYNFGAAGDGLSGSVYVDSNNDGVRDSGEQGIPGVTVTLSGNMANSQSVCTVVTCAAVTDAAGNFNYPGLSDSDATGYTLTEQPQANAPLSNYGDGQDTAGDVAGSTVGTAGNDVISDIVISGGMLAQNYLFGEHSASLAGTVYVDSNNNGTPQAGELLLENIAITLSGTTDNAEDVCTFLAALSPSRGCTATSSASGDYQFNDLPAGTYTITQTTQPASYADGLEAVGLPTGTVDNTPGVNTISNITLGAGAQGSGYHFGERGAVIGGRVVKDVNRDGTLTDPEDAGLGGIELSLLDAGSNQIGTTTTDSNGNYSFVDLPAGSYTVVETQPAGYGSSTANSVVSMVAAGATATVDFGDTVSTLAGTAFIDADGSGTRNGGELGLANVTVNIAGTDDGGNNINRNVTTDPTGNYSINDLLSGTYTLTETQPNGYADGLDSLGSAGGTLGNDVVTAIGLPAATDATGYAFGEVGQALSGAVYIDENGNGSRDTGEAGIPGVLVTLSGTTTNNNDVCSLVSCIQATDGSGNYQYLNVPGSNATGYTLTEQSQATPPLSNYADGQDAAGAVAGTTRGSAANDVITGIVINVSETASGYTFGELAIGLSGAVYSDTNDSGIQDPGEPGIGGVTVTLSGTTATAEDICVFLGSLVPAQSCVRQTAANGSFLFPDIPAGTYILTETQPTAYTDGRENPGSPAGSVNNGSFGAGAGTNQITNLVLSAGQAGSAYTFGERGAVVTGTVFKDTDRNGTQDNASETGVAGVVINLRDSGGTIIASTTTATDGSFRFTDLPQGNYSVEEVQPAGYGFSSPQTVAVTLTPAGSATVNFANTLSTLAGVVYVDINDNATQDSGERGLPGVELTLSGINVTGGSVTRTATTALDGTYVFDDVLAGTYSIIETHPLNFSDGDEAAGSAGGTVTDDRIDNIILGTAVDAVGYTFGEGGQVLAGTVYVDLNRNGLQDPGEEGIAGVALDIRDAGGTVIEVVTTNSSGNYGFQGVAAGAYDLVQTQPAGYGSGIENESNSAPVTVAVGVVNEPFNFGETTGSIGGRVFNDLNGNGLRDANDPVIPSVDIRLSGTDAQGVYVDRTTASDAGGHYVFSDVVGGTYDLTETQPIGFVDAADYVGSVGGTLGNDSITGVVLPAAMNATDYRFTETGNSAAIEGAIWRDADHDRVRELSETNIVGWTVQLRLGDAILHTTTTDANGEYRFTDVPPGSGYSLAFINPTSNAEFGGAQPNETGGAYVDGQIDTNNPGGAVIDSKSLTELTLLPSTTLTQQSLPLDPSGIVYDAVSRLPLEGAVVQINGPPGFDPAIHLVGGAANVNQTTGTDGVYQYLLLPGAPSGQYDLSVTAPIGAYNPVTPSNLIPPCPGTLTVGPTPNPLLVQTNATPPPQGVAVDCAVGTNSTVYYLGFNIDVSSSAEILQNHIPIDPILEDAILVSKRTAKTYAVRGELVPYTITATNTLPGPLNGVQLVDRIPPGFKFRSGSARIDGLPAIPQVRGNELVWNNVDFDTGQERELSVLLVVGSGTTEGKKTNYAFAFNPIADATISNVADATVRIIPDPNTDCTDIIGKVFDDKNANGYQDRGEPGLPGVRVVTVRGLLITTDNKGRYHIACPYIANEELGSNFIVKLDTRTLPTGYRVTTDNPHTMRIARGKFVKMNFGATNMDVIRIDIDANAFNNDDLTPNFKDAIEQLVDLLQQQPTVLRIAYTARGERKRVVKQRIRQVRGVIAQWWEHKERNQRLIIEEETITTTDKRTPAPKAAAGGRISD